VYFGECLVILRAFFILIVHCNFKRIPGRNTHTAKLRSEFDAGKYVASRCVVVFPTDVNRRCRL